MMEILGPLKWVKKFAELFRAQSGLREKLEALEPGGEPVLVDLPEDHEIKLRLGGKRYEIDQLRVRRLGKPKP